MSYFSKEEWMEYIAGTLPTEKQLILEEHLLDCDECLSIYMKCVEAIETFPSLENPEQFADNVMENLPSVKVEPIQKVPRKRKFYQSSLFHYGIAAAITVMFMSSGIFTEILNFINMFQAESITPNSATITDTIMDKTVNFLDQFDKGGNNVK